jgi:hypothetical protein
MLRILIIAAALTTTIACFAAEVPFAELHKSPASFAGTKVAVRGLVEVAGDYIFLWPDPATCKKEEFKKSIFVLQDLRKPSYPRTNLSPYSPANLRWAIVSGTVDTSYHGMFGDTPFGLLLEKIEVLPGPRLKDLLPVLAYLHNETGKDVKVQLKAGSITEESTISAGAVYDSAIPRYGWKVVISFSGRPIISTVVRRSSAAYYNRARREYYYRITSSSIAPVRPEGTSHWKFPPTPERD